MTAPLGVLKAGSIAFDPALPPAKAEAVARLGHGTFEKVVLVFAEWFWGDALGGGLAVLSGFGGERAFPLFVDLSVFAGAPTLVCIYSGAFATKAQAAMAPGELIAGATKQLARGLGRPVPAPVATAATRWATDPYSLGSYSYVPVGAGAGDMDALAAPVGGRLLFAGEATVAAHRSTVHGAFLSGLREARRIAPAARIG